MSASSSINSKLDSTITSTGSPEVQPLAASSTAELFQTVVESSTPSSSSTLAERTVSTAARSNRFSYRVDPEQEANDGVRGFGAVIGGGIALFGGWVLPMPHPLLGGAGVLIGSEAITQAFGEERQGLTTAAGALMLAAAATVGSEDPAAALTMLAPIGFHLVTWLPGADTRNTRMAQITTLAIAVISIGTYYMVGMSDSSANIGRGIQATLAIALTVFVILGGMRGASV